MRPAISEAMAMRRAGAPRESGLAHLFAAGLNEALAEMIMDHCDAANEFARARREQEAAAGAAPSDAEFESRRQRSRRFRH